MFKSSENLRLAAEMRALERVARPWREARRSWFDGTPESIEGRLASTERVLTYARSGTTPAHMALEHEASAARAELKEASHRLMVDFLDDGARAFKGSRRVAKDSPEGRMPGYEPGKTCMVCEREDRAKGSEFCPDCDEQSSRFERDRQGSKRVAFGMHEIEDPDYGFPSEHEVNPYTGEPGRSMHLDGDGTGAHWDSNKHYVHSDPRRAWERTMSDEPYWSLQEPTDFADLALDGDYEGRHRQGRRVAGTLNDFDDALLFGD